MQLMPATAAAMASVGKERFATDTLTNPKVNIGFGAQHLKDLLNLYKNDLVLAVAAYNAGSGNVNRWRKTFGALRRNEFIESIPFVETREYVKKVISGAELYDRLYKLDSSEGAAPPATEKQPVPEPQKMPISRTEKTVS
jgi:soluble lytic murein transglycosylase